MSSPPIESGISKEEQYGVRNPFNDSSHEIKDDWVFVERDDEADIEIPSTLAIVVKDVVEIHKRYHPEIAAAGGIAGLGNFIAMLWGPTALAGSAIVVSALVLVHKLNPLQHRQGVQNAVRASLAHLQRTVPRVDDVAKQRSISAQEIEEIEQLFKSRIKELQEALDDKDLCQQLQEKVLKYSEENQKDIEQTIVKLDELVKKNPQNEALLKQLGAIALLCDLLIPKKSPRRLNDEGS